MNEDISSYDRNSDTYIKKKLEQTLKASIIKVTRIKETLSSYNYNGAVKLANNLVNVIENNTYHKNVSIKLLDDFMTNFNL
jgi:hypothetical protein